MLRQISRTLRYLLRAFNRHNLNMMRNYAQRLTTRNNEQDIVRRLRVNISIYLRLITSTMSSITLKRHLLHSNYLNCRTSLLTRYNNTIRIIINNVRTLLMILRRISSLLQILLYMNNTRRHRTNSRLNITSLIPLSNRIRRGTRTTILRLNNHRVKLKRRNSNIFLHDDRLNDRLEYLTMVFSLRVFIKISTILPRRVTRRMLQNDPLTNKRSNTTLRIYGTISNITLFRRVRRTRHIRNRSLSTTTNLLMRNNNRINQSNDSIRFTLSRLKRSLVNNAMRLRIMILKDHAILFRNRRVRRARNNKTFRTNCPSNNIHLNQYPTNRRPSRRHHQRRRKYRFFRRYIIPSSLSLFRS